MLRYAVALLILVSNAPASGHNPRIGKGDLVIFKNVLVTHYPDGRTSYECKVVDIGIDAGGAKVLFCGDGK